MFTDDDCYLGEDYFQTAHQVFEGEPFGYCSGRILLYDPSDAAYGAQEQDTFEIISPYSFIPPGRFQRANLIIRRQVFDEIGLFDPETWSRVFAPMWNERRSGSKLAVNCCKGRAGSWSTCSDRGR